MLFEKIIAHNPVGTRFIASGNSLPCRGVNPGGKRGEWLHGNELPDAVNGVPTGDGEALPLFIH
jgi:hypothetical protein